MGGAYKFQQMNKLEIDTNQSHDPRNLQQDLLNGPLNLSI